MGPFGPYLQNYVYYTIFDSMIEKYMVNSSRYLVVTIFESVVVVAEVGEYPDLVLSMGILVRQRLSDRTRGTYGTVLNKLLFTSDRTPSVEYSEYRSNRDAHWGRGSF